MDVYVCIQSKQPDGVWVDIGRTLDQEDGRRGPLLGPHHFQRLPGTESTFRV